MTPSASSCAVQGPFSEEVVKSSSSEMLEKIGGKVTFALAFISQDYSEHLEDFCEIVQLYGHCPIVYGCTGCGVIGTNVEVEGQAGFSLIFLYLPETKITAVSLDQGIIESTEANQWEKRTKVDSNEVDAWILLADPLSMSVEGLLEGWSQAYAGVPLLGGLASARPPQEGRIEVFKDGAPIEGGGLALALQGGVEIRWVVSQGCRPIGEPLTITQSDQNIVYQLGSKSAYEVLNDVVEDLSEEEKENIRGNLLAGLANSEYLEEFQRGDFLVRNIMGAEPSSGGVALGAFPRMGQTLQYQLRDKSTASEDLEILLSDLRTEIEPPFAALLFSCAGRGKSLFGESNHDAATLAETFGKIPTAGFFGNGEIGPVGGQSFLHGYTVAVVLLTKKGKS